MDFGSHIVEINTFHPMSSAFKIPFFNLLVCIFLIGCNGNKFSSENEDSESSSKSEPVLRKGNLGIFVLGRNRLEIETLFGIPYEKYSEDGNLVVWRYRRAVFDEATSITYDWSRLNLKFTRGLCSNVSVDLEQRPLADDESTEVDRSSVSPALPLFRKLQ
tara:strand:- start:1349 stop:1831 length:483 start_codon:yes stop_codon:yes gene_type:complete